jgi:hypothetical protein
MVAAFAVHVFTACGAACALLALIAAVRAEWARMFLWLGLALIIDGVDGTLARRLRVAELLPRWSGELLDFVVDFTTYVFVPAYAIAAGGLLPPAAALPLGLIVTVTGALYFADRRMKTPDSYFRGSRRCGTSRRSICSCSSRCRGWAPPQSPCLRRRHSRPSILSTPTACRDGACSIWRRWCCGPCWRCSRLSKTSIRLHGLARRSPRSPSIS